MKSIQSKLDTQLIHAGEPQPRIHGAVCLPIFQTVNYEYTSAGDDQELRYIRLNNTPNHVALHKKLASIENGEAALVFASGMAAIATTLLTILKSGEHLLIQNSLYGGTHSLITHDLPAFGIQYDFFNAADPISWKTKLRPNTRVIYVETITNPLMQVGELPEVVKFSREHRLISVIDNTFASPVNFRPLERGFDLSLHSATKYLNGHSDIAAGALVGSQELVAQVKNRLDHLGGSLDPHAAFLLHRGLKTLALRVRCQNENALQMANYLQNHPAIQRVNYPGLPNSPGHSIANQLFNGFGGMLSFELVGDIKEAENFLRRLSLPIVAPSLGSVESLVTRPAATTHSSLTPAERQQAGISDSLIRLSVGIEAVEDLLEDISQALC